MATLLITVAKALSLPPQVLARASHVLVYCKAPSKKNKGHNQLIASTKSEPLSCDLFLCAKHYEGQIPVPLIATSLLNAWNGTKETPAYLHCGCFVPVTVNTDYNVEDNDVLQSCSFNKVSFPAPELQTVQWCLCRNNVLFQSDVQLPHHYAFFRGKPLGMYHVYVFISL